MTNSEARASNFLNKNNPSRTGAALPIALGTMIILLFSWFVSLKLVRFVSKLSSLKTKRGAQFAHEHLNMSKAHDAALTRMAKAQRGSISAEYEEMFLINPKLYVGSLEALEVQEDYRKLMAGDIMDVNLTHMPAEQLSGTKNPDLIRYLLKQKELFDDKGLNTHVIVEAIDKITSAEKLDKMAHEYRHILKHEMGMDTEMVDLAINIERMKSYTPEEWKDLADNVKGWLSSGISRQAVKVYLASFTNPNTSTEIDVLDHLLSLEVPVHLAIRAASQQVTLDDVYSIAENNAMGVSWEDAIILVADEKAAGNGG